MMTFKIFYGHGTQEQLPEHQESKSFRDVEDYWLGRSCGAKHRTNNDVTPVVSSGIVLYPGHKYEESADELQVTRHINTRNGPVTVISHTFQKSYKAP